MNIPNVLHNIFWFKYRCMVKKSDAGKDPKSLPKRRREVLEHEQLKEDLNYEFNQLNEQNQALSIVSYLVKFANVSKVNDRMFTFVDSDEEDFDQEISFNDPLMVTFD